MRTRIQIQDITTDSLLNIAPQEMDFVIGGYSNPIIEGINELIERIFTH